MAWVTAGQASLDPSLRTKPQHTLADVQSKILVPPDGGTQTLPHSYQRSGATTSAVGVLFPPPCNSESVSSYPRGAGTALRSPHGCTHGFWLS